MQEDRQASRTPEKGGRGAPGKGAVGKTKGLGKEELREARERTAL